MVSGMELFVPIKKDEFKIFKKHIKLSIKLKAYKFEKESKYKILFKN